MPSLDDDPWIAAHPHLAPAKLHALGLLTFRWNGCEYWTHATFSEALGVSERRSRVVTHDLGDITLWTKIVELAKARSFPPDVVETLEHASKLYDRCRSNRNLYVHAGAGSAPSYIEDGSVLTMIRTKGPSMDWPRIPDSLSDLRRVAEDIGDLNRYLEYAFFQAHAANEGRQERPLRDKPPLPASIWSPHPKRQPKRPRQPQSSHVNPKPDSD